MSIFRAENSGRKSTSRDRGGSLSFLTLLRSAGVRDACRCVPRCEAIYRQVGAHREPGVGKAPAGRCHDDPLPGAGSRPIAGVEAGRAGRLPDRAWRDGHPRAVRPLLGARRWVVSRPRAPVVPPGDTGSSHAGRRPYSTHAARKSHRWGGLRDVQKLAGHPSRTMTPHSIKEDTEATRQRVALRGHGVARSGSPAHRCGTTRPRAAVAASLSSIPHGPGLDEAGLASWEACHPTTS